MQSKEVSFRKAIDMMEKDGFEGSFFHGQFMADMIDAGHLVSGYQSLLELWRLAEAKMQQHLSEGESRPAEYGMTLQFGTGKAVLSAGGEDRIEFLLGDDGGSIGVSLHVAKDPSTPFSVALVPDPPAAKEAKVRQEGVGVRW